MSRDAIAAPESGQAPFDRTDWLLLIGLTAAALVLRFWAIGVAGIDHFDEGGYAISALAVATGQIPENFVPLQHFLSPPVYFGSSGLLMRLTGVTGDIVLLAVSGALGALTVTLAYVFGRTTLGRPAGLAAAALLALSDYHILYSGAVLTDVAFAFFFLLALWAYSEADARESLLWAILAGVATGLAWNTKYHGWLAGVVAGAALVPHLWEHSLRRFAQGVGRLVAAAVVATAMYAPWYVYVSGQPGGYARVVAEHRSFLSPLHAHYHVLAHLRHQLFLDGWISRLAPALALLLLAATLTGAMRSRALRRLPAFLVAGLALGSTVTATLLAIVGLAKVIPGEGPRRWMPVAFLAAFTGLSPMYFPYARLLLPWVLGIFVLGGLGLSIVATADDIESALPHRALRRATLGLTAVLLVTCLAVRPPWLSPDTYAPSDGFEAAAQAIAEIAPPGTPIVVLGEPGVAYYLRRTGWSSIHANRPADMLGTHSPGDSVTLVAGRYSRAVGGPGGIEGWREANPGAALPFDTVPVRRVSDVRLLDDMEHEEARAYRAAPTGSYDLVLYRARVPEPPPSGS